MSLFFYYIIKIFFLIKKKKNELKMKLPSFQELTKFLNEQQQQQHEEKLPHLVIKTKTIIESLPQPRPECFPEPFCCPFCDRPFRRKSDMIRHGRIHLKIKPFPCFYCNKRFTRRDTLSRHCETTRHKLKKK